MNISRVSEVRVRRAIRADAAAVAVLNAHVHQMHVHAEPYDFRPTEPVELEEFFALVLSGTQHVVLLAEHDNLPIGYVWLEDQARPANPFKNATHVLSLNHIAVAPAFRRLGVGRSLYAAAEAEARSRGITRLVMDHWSFNDDAAAFFGSLGFESFNVRMRKLLSES